MQIKVLDNITLHFWSGRAVSAITGISGFIWIIISLNRRYSGRKSCPHSEIQCASSTAKKEIFRSEKNSRFSCLVNVSGAT